MLGSTFVRAIAYPSLSSAVIGSAVAESLDDEYTTLARFDNDIFFGSDPDIGMSVSIRWRGWRVALARYVRTCEFSTQEDRSEVGSVTIRREW